MKKTTILKSILVFVASSAMTFAQKQETLFGQPKDYVTTSAGQKIIRCGSSQYENHLQKNALIAPKEEFESWLADKIKEAKSDATKRRETNVVVTIPVVVHVLHAGENIGVGANISDLRVQSQITVLNQDYRRMLNTNGYNNDANGADVEVEFCLVKQNPSGGASNGINRVNITSLGVNSGYGEGIVESVLKPRTIWDPTRYMNIWVGDFYASAQSDLRGVLGYAQFPSNSTLPGLNGMPSGANTDGVIIDWRCFGSNAIASGSYLSGFAHGRTTTHEVGHYLGLRHVNGDNSSCTVDATDSFNDFCLDTPAQVDLHQDCDSAYDTCPNSPGLDNVTNYMDYSQDLCLNKFTQNQKTRIRTVLLNSPRRASLVTSNACSLAVTYAKDLEIIPSATSTGCSQFYDLSVLVNNVGTETVSNATINYTLGNAEVLTYTYTGTLAPGASTTINFTNIPFATIGNNNLTFNVITVNGSNDQNDLNDNKTLTVSTPLSVPTNAENSVEFYMLLDPYGSENSFSVRNLTTNQVIATGGPYQNTLNPMSYNPQSFIISNLVAGNCYEITFLDSDGDGLLQDGFIGLFKPPYESQDVIYAVQPNSSSTIIRFTYNFTLGMDDMELVGDKLTVYPNPTNSILNIGLGANTDLPKAYTIFNTLGQVVKSNSVQSSNDLMVDVDHLSNGVYMIKIDTLKGSQTIKFVKQ